MLSVALSRHVLLLSNQQSLRTKLGTTLLSRIKEASRKLREISVKPCIAQRTTESGRGIGVAGVLLRSFSLGLTVVKAMPLGTNTGVDDNDKAKTSKGRLVDICPQKEAPDKEARFDWIQFLKLLFPHTWYLLAAIASAMVAAYLNIQV